LEAVFDALLHLAKHEPADDERDDDHSGGVEAVASDRVGQRLAAVERSEPDGARPGDAAARVPEEELPPGHVREPCHSRRTDAEDRDEAPEEHGLAAVSLHDPLDPRQHAVRVPPQPSPPAEERAPAESPEDPVAEVVADDRGRRGDHDHPDDRVMPLCSEHAEGDQRGLARQGDAERLEHDHDEEQRQPVRDEEMRHRGESRGLNRHNDCDTSGRNP
jgi:hypothetical protein